MGGSSGKSKNKSKNKGKLNQKVWGVQAPHLESLFGQAGDLFGWSSGGMQDATPELSGQIGGIADQMQSPWQQQMQGGAYAGMPLQQMYQNAAKGGGNEQAMNEMIMGGAGNDYADAMRGQLERDAATRLGGAMSALDARAAASNMSGGSRHGIAQGQAISDVNQSLADQQTKLGYETFDKDLQRKMDIARRADQFDMGRMQNIGNMLGQQQGAMQGGLNFGQGMQNAYMGRLSPYMAPWQAMGAYTNAIGAPTILTSGSNLGSASGKSKSAGFGK